MRPVVERWESGSTCAVPGQARVREGARVAAVSAIESSPGSGPQDPPSDAMPTGPLEIPDIADIPAVEVVLTVAMHLMTASAVACGLSLDEDGAPREADLAEARILINALAALVTASAPDLGSVHAAPLRDGLTAVQRAFREASTLPDAPGEGPGERFTGPVV
jgi:hypothetical protein